MTVTGVRAGSRRVLLAVSAGVTVGYLAGNVLPSLLAAYTADFSLSSTAAGAVATAMLLATAIAGAALAVRATRPGRARLARLGALLAALGFLGGAVAPSLVTLSLAAVVAGIGSGVVVASATAAIASTDAPDRTSGIAVLVNTLVVCLLLAGLPLLGASARAVGFLGLAVLCVLAIPFLAHLPDVPTHAAYGRAPHRLAGVFLLLAAVTFAMSETGLWAFSQVIGMDSVGLDEQTVGLALSAASFVGLAGALLAAVLGGRRGYAVPVVSLLLLGAAAKVVVILASDSTTYVTAQVIWGFTFPAVFAYLLALGAVLDPQGRWSMSVGVALAFGGALGPLIAGGVIDLAGLIAFAGVEVLLGVITLLAVVPTLRERHDVQ